MPVINGTKYACCPCIRGHRSTTCNHSPRMLWEVRKRGRPLQDCPHHISDDGDSCQCCERKVFIKGIGVTLPPDDAVPPEEVGRRKKMGKARERAHRESLAALSSTDTVHAMNGMPGLTLHTTGLASLRMSMHDLSHSAAGVRGTAPPPSPPPSTPASMKHPFFETYDSIRDARRRAAPEIAVVLPQNAAPSSARSTSRAGPSHGVRARAQSHGDLSSLIPFYDQQLSPFVAAGMAAAFEGMPAGGDFQSGIDAAFPSPLLPSPQSSPPSSRPQSSSMDAPAEPENNEADPSTDEERPPAPPISAATSSRSGGTGSASGGCCSGSSEGREWKAAGCGSPCGCRKGRTLAPAQLMLRNGSDGPSLRPYQAGMTWQSFTGPSSYEPSAFMLDGGRPLSTSEHPSHLDGSGAQSQSQSLGQSLGQLWQQHADMLSMDHHMPNGISPLDMRPGSAGWAGAFNMVPWDLLDGFAGERVCTCGEDCSCLGHQH